MSDYPIPDGRIRSYELGLDPERGVQHVMGRIFNSTDPKDAVLEVHGPAGPSLRWDGDAWCGRVQYAALVTASAPLAVDLDAPVCAECLAAISEARRKRDVKTGETKPRLNPQGVYAALGQFVENLFAQDMVCAVEQDATGRPSWAVKLHDGSTVVVRATEDA